MSDKLARAVGAGQTIEVAGKEYRIRPIGLIALQEVQREALRSYKAAYLESWVDGATRYLKDSSEEIVSRKIDEVAAWDVADLPPKYVHDVSGVRWSRQICRWLAGKYGDLPDREATQRALLATALDTGEITIDRVKALGGGVVRRQRAPYDAWWCTATYEGMVTFVWAGLGGGRDGAPTRIEVQAWPLPKLIEAARIVEAVTVPAVGNTSRPVPKGGRRPNPRRRSVPG